MVRPVELVYSRALRVFEAVLRDYEKQATITLVKHPLAEQLQNRDSVESVIAFLGIPEGTFAAP